jgi:hypothetical protein
MTIYSRTYSRPSITEADRIWFSGYRAGVSDRFWPRLRRVMVVTALLAVVPVLWHVAFGRGDRGVLYDLLRGPAAVTLLALLVLGVGLSPLWIVLLSVSLWRTHARHRRMLYRPPIDEPPFTDAEGVSGLPTPVDHRKVREP